jgi:hypothetical protein
MLACVGLALAGCVHRIEPPRAVPARDKLQECNPGECVEDHFEMPRWAHTERLRGRMPYHTDPGGQLYGKANPRVERVILVIHGLYGLNGYRDVDSPPGLNAYRSIKHALRVAEKADPDLDRSRVAIIAPSFQFNGHWEPFTEDDPRYWKWGRGSWSGGNLSAASGENMLGNAENDPVSSHAVFDGMLQVATIKYPNAETFVVVGHSLGAQTVHRYALLGTGNHEHLERAGIHTRYVVGNPGSYTYLWPERKVPPGRSKVVLDGVTDSTKKWTWRKPKGCKDYDKFYLGLAGYEHYWRAARAAEYLLREYMPGLDRKAWRQIKREPGSKLEREWAMKLFNYQYSQRDIWHLQAEPDTEQHAPTCGWTQQGRSRIERWRHFQESWHRYTYWKSDSVRFEAVPGLTGGRAHSGNALYGSKIGIQVLFY